MIFERSNSNDLDVELNLGNDKFEIVENYKYLGHCINRQLLDITDVKCRLNNFYGKFNSVFRNFKNVSIETFLFLFNSYCLPDYGLNLWNVQAVFNRQIFKTFEVGFSNALKRIVGAPVYSSSHVTADLCNQLLLQHHIAFIQARYLKRVFAYQNDITKLCLPFLKSGYLSMSVTKLFKDTYDTDFWTNEIDVLKARVDWVQKHENRRGTCPFYGI